MFQDGANGAVWPLYNACANEAKTFTHPRWATIPLLFSPHNAMPMGYQARSIACNILMTSSTIAKCSRQAQSHTAISPNYTGPLHFPFSMFRHYYLSSQSPVSPFPHGTCLLLVSNIYSALDENYHLLHAPVPRNMTLRKHTVHWGLQITHRILTFVNASSQKLIVTPQLVAHLELTIQSPRL